MTTQPATITSVTTTSRTVPRMAAPGASHPPLSRREMQVLGHLAAGRTSRQTSTRLGISPRTVETYIERLRDKLDAPTRAQLIRAAVLIGL